MNFRYHFVSMKLIPKSKAKITPLCFSAVTTSGRKQYKTEDESWYIHYLLSDLWIDFTTLTQSAQPDFHQSLLYLITNCKLHLDEILPADY